MYYKPWQKKNRSGQKLIVVYFNSKMIPLCSFSTEHVFKKHKIISQSSSGGKQYTY